MAIETYRRSFTPAGGTEFWYDSPYEWDRQPSNETQDMRIPQGDTSADGEYQADSTQGPRVFTIKGMIIASSPSDLQNKLDTLFAAHPAYKEGVLRRQIKNGSTIVSDRTIRCRVSSRTKGPEIGLAYNNWEISFRASQPFYEDVTAQTPVTLTAPGTTAITAGGTEKSPLIITLNVTGTGLITLTPSATMGTDSAFYFAFNALASGTYIIDNRAKTFAKDGVSALDKISGIGAGFFYLPPTATNLVVTAPSGNLNATGNTAVWRRRWSTT